MKQIGSLRSFIYNVAIYSYFSCAFGISIMGVLLSINVKPTTGFLVNRPVWTRLVEVLQGLAIPIYVALGVVIVACFIVRSFGNPWIYQKIKFVLDQYHEKCFENVKDDPTDHHRVTLFKCKRVIFKTRGSGLGREFFPRYLVPILRSGHMSQKSTAMFYISDDSAKVEGVAGQAWSVKSTIVVGGLPNPSEERKNAKRYSQAVSAYAVNTKLPAVMITAYIDKNRPLSRSLAAIPVMVNEQIWGVVVLDSRKPDGVTKESVKHYEWTVAFIGQLLEKA